MSQLETIEGEQATELLNPYLDTKLTHTLCGQPRNRRLNLSRAPTSSVLFGLVAERIGCWAVSPGIGVVASSSRDAERYVLGAQRLFPELPVLIYRRRDDELVIHESINDARERVGDGKSMVGIVFAQLVTGRALLEFAQKAPLLSGVPKTGLVIADRSQKVAGVHTVAEAERYLEEHPSELPPRADMPFAIKALFEYSMPLYVPPSQDSV